MISIFNPFDACVYYEEVVGSTMDVSRKLAAAGEAHGTVIVADYQSAGRGRIKGRVWRMESKVNLAFTILLRFPCTEKIPQAITLRAGLAVSLAIEDFAPSLKDRVKVKWPNDVLIDRKKAAGILCEASDGIVHIGIGVNVGQKEFPVELEQKATSITLAARNVHCTLYNEHQDRFLLLEKILNKLYTELYSIDWKCRLEKRLYKTGEQVLFTEGAADSGNKIEGILCGISEMGEILIDGTPYAAGELVM